MPICCPFCECVVFSFQYVNSGDQSQIDGQLVIKCLCPPSHRAYWELYRYKCVFKEENVVTQWLDDLLKVTKLVYSSGPSGHWACAHLHLCCLSRHLQVLYTPATYLTEFPSRHLWNDTCAVWKAYHEVCRWLQMVWTENNNGTVLMYSGHLHVHVSNPVSSTWAWKAKCSWRQPL